MENKVSGIFALLDDECKLPQPNLNNFMQRVNSTHAKCDAFSSIHDGFTICHFAKNVSYTAVRGPNISYQLKFLYLIWFIFQENFIESNAESKPKSLDILMSSVLTKIDNNEAASSIGMVCRTKNTISTTFRKDIDSLLLKLKQTVSICIK